MLPGYILSFCMYKLLCIAIRDLRGSEEFVCFLFLASQTMIGYLCSRIVKLLTGEERLLLRKPRVKGVAERVTQNVQGKNQNEHEKCRTSDQIPRQRRSCPSAIITPQLGSNWTPSPR